MPMWVNSAFINSLKQVCVSIYSILKLSYSFIHYRDEPLQWQYKLFKGMETDNVAKYG